ncbi:MYND-type domain-containing protein [Mycena chlorophos]|uniref:MYND-type domain-containing protein n=1 Tax=Mycena chlorophos TaxID=658473 RepID=A0A8H6WD52_MYCCL|nr:MYND-type domain-containing protein [Mycena chlorophos]
MVLPVYFQENYFFYPLGNVSAVSLLRDVPPEGPVTLLLAGCGDPRNILYSLYSELPTANRKLDFTCCDIDPAILARNVLLYTMLADDVASDIIWNIFFHFHLDQSCLSRLEAHCQKLLDIRSSLDAWKSSPYAEFIQFGTLHTFQELRRHWRLYVDMKNIPSSRLSELKSDLWVMTKKALGVMSMCPFGLRSAAPFVWNAEEACSTVYKTYWTTGTTFTTESKQRAAKFLNPTFIYCLAGEGVYFHYATDPVAPFHLAELFSRDVGVSARDLVAFAQRQFQSWGSAYRKAITSQKPPVIRCVVSDALALCRALKLLNETGNIESPFAVVPWKPEIVRLDGGCYGRSSMHVAPTMYDVIATTNLTDHLGLLNILVTSVPLLQFHGVLYTESISPDAVDPSRDFVKRLHGDIQTMFFLLDIHAVEYLSGFSAISNAHEVFLQQSMWSQHHQPTTWKVAISGDSSVNEAPAMLWDSQQLGDLLFGIYRRIFESEDMQVWWRNNLNNLEHALQKMATIHYMRETFSLVLRHVRERFKIAEGPWGEVMDRFLAQTPRIDSAMQSDHDMAAHLHLQSLHTAGLLTQIKSR